MMHTFSLPERRWKQSQQGPRPAGFRCCGVRPFWHFGSRLAPGKPGGGRRLSVRGEGGLWKSRRWRGWGFDRDRVDWCGARGLRFGRRRRGFVVRRNGTREATIERRKLGLETWVIQEGRRLLIL